MRRVLVLLVLVIAPVLAQGLGEVEVSAEPHHHLVLQNQYVRVFKVDVPPHRDTLMHRHRHDYVVVTLGDADVENDVEGKAAVSWKFKDGQTLFVPGNYAHVAKNLADTPFRNVTIELLQDERARQNPPKWEEERGLNILEGGTQDVLFVKDGVRVSEVQLQPGAMIPKHSHPGPQLLVAVTDLELRTSPVGRTSEPVKLKAGDAQWVPAGPAHTLMNLGTKQARFITLEFK